ncbi:FAD/NAD(P)-binding domain-containing protein [Pyrenochaeta sp. DS3sAY3a]|nr:FAD/NAD(P)-binding domain-containing protein [Pyrenochaeta sp. DS3sAY3a]
MPALKPRKLKVVCVGAGFAGLMLSYEHRHGKSSMHEFVDLTIYEKNADVGGTWLENRYPGVACDVPAHIYTFPFEPNPSWSSFYASGPEILAYIKKTTAKYSLDRCVRLNTKILSSVWDNETSKWRLKIRSKDSKIFEDDADVLINCSGFLSKWNWPKIKGLHDFSGSLLHSAAWDSTLDWAGKKVAIIGNGSSAVQMLPEIQRTAAKVFNYVRSPLWVSNNFASEFTPEGKNFSYKESEIEDFKKNPDKLAELRHQIEHAFNKFFYVLLKESPEQAGAFKAISKNMADSLNNDPWLCAKLIPTFEVGCRRLSPGDNYLKALQEKNVTIDFGPIQEVGMKGIKTLNGKEEEFDIIICATGFDVSFCPSWDVQGRDGRKLADQWADHPEAYFGICVPNMPNYFTVNGPNSPLAHGSLLSVMHWTVEYIVRWCDKMAKQDIKSVEVRLDATEDYNAYSHEFLKRTVWTGDCRSWFKNGRVEGRVTAMYAGSVLHFKEMLQTFRSEDFDYEYGSANRFRFMGNGITTREQRGEDLAYYMRR